MTGGADAQAVLDALPFGLTVSDAAHRFVYANPAFWQVLGAGQSACPYGSPVAELFRLAAYRGLYGPGDPEAQAAASAALDRSRPSRRQYRSADGSRTIDVISQPLPGGGFLTMGVDVTGPARAREEAVARARAAEGTLARLSSGIGLFDAGMRLLLLNPAYEALCGLSPGALRPGLTHRDVLAAMAAMGELGPAEAEEIAERMEADPGRAATRQRRRPSGEVLRYRVQPMPDGGQLVEIDEITALRHAQDEASRRAALLDGVLSALPQGVCVYSPDRRVTLTNPAYARIMEGSPVAIGETLAEVVGRRVAAGEFPTETGQAILAMHDGPGGPGGVRTRVRPDGTVLESRVAPLPDGGSVALISDVTALHRAEAEARHRAEVLGAMLDNMLHGICLFDEEMRVVAANALAARLTGLEEADFVPGRFLTELQLRQRERGEFGSAEEERNWRPSDFHPGKVRPGTFRRLRPDGSVVEIRTARTPDGRFVRTYSDITELVRAEEETRRRAAMLEAMLGNLRHGLALFDAERRLLAVNAKASALGGVPPEAQYVGQPIEALLEEQHRRGAIGAADVAAGSGMDRTRPVRYERPTPDGRVLEVFSDPTPEGGFTVTFTDVTEDRRIRAELDRARVAAEAASEAKSRFLAIMSHELRTPLNAVIGFSEAIGQERDPKRIAEYAGMINDSGRQLLKLVDDILDVARSETGELRVAAEPVETARVLREAALDGRAAAEAAGLSLVVAVPDDLPRLRGDALRLRQILGGLLSNAVKFTPAGGRITLAAEAGPAGLVIRVADTGIGVPEAERERMFEPFTQADSSLTRRHAGSGLGLHLARRLAASLGGTLTLEDAGGPGIVAALRFPGDRLLPISGETPTQDGLEP